MNRHEWLETVISADRSVTALQVASALWKFMDASAYCFPKQETMADLLGVSVSTVSAGLKELEEIGLISRSRRRSSAAYQGTQNSGHTQDSGTQNSGDTQNPEGPDTQNSGMPPYMEPNQENLNDNRLTFDEVVLEVCEVFERAGLKTDNLTAENIVRKGRQNDVELSDIVQWVTDSVTAMNASPKFTKSNIISALQKTHNIRRWKEAQRPEPVPTNVVRFPGQIHENEYIEDAVVELRKWHRDVLKTFHMQPQAKQFAKLREWNRDRHLQLEEHEFPELLKVLQAQGLIRA